MKTVLLLLTLVAFVTLPTHAQSLTKRPPSTKSLLATQADPQAERAREQAIREQQTRAQESEMRKTKKWPRRRARHRAATPTQSTPVQSAPLRPTR